MSGAKSAWSPSYRTNEPPAVHQPTVESLAAYNKDFHGILDNLVAQEFFTTKDANGRVAEGKRFPALSLDDPSLTEDQKAYLSGPHTKVGPGNAWARSPKVSRHMSAAASEMNSHGALPPVAKEIAILSTARHFNSEFEWYAHEPPALHAGLSPASVAHIRNDLPPPCSTMTEDENVYYAFCYQQFHQKRVDQETWEGVRRLIGEKGGIELNAMMAFYTYVSFCLNLDEFPVPPVTEGILNPPTK